MIDPNPKQSACQLAIRRRARDRPECARQPAAGGGRSPRAAADAGTRGDETGETDLRIDRARRRRIGRQAAG